MKIKFEARIALAVLALSLVGCANELPKQPLFLGRTVFIGDSITAFWDLNASFSVQEAINAGVPGQSTGDILARFEHDAIAPAPHTIMILAGTNDILNETNDISTAAANVASMVELSKANGIRAIVCTLPPVAANIAELNAKYAGIDFNPSIDAYNGLLREAYGNSCDYHQALSLGDTDTPISGTLKDGVHPTAFGYYLMSRVASQIGPSVSFLRPLSLSVQPNNQTQIVELRIAAKRHLPQFPASQSRGPSDCLADVPLQLYDCTELVGECPYTVRVSNER